MIKRLELILFRFSCLAAVGGFLFCLFVALFTDSSHERQAAAVAAVLGPTSVMVVFYGIRWGLTGRLKPWVPAGEISDRT